MARMEEIGAFGLTRARRRLRRRRGLTTTAHRLPREGGGDTWTLHGVKKWIGNATFADVTVIWAATSTTAT